MFTRVDRLQLATPHRSAAARGWMELLGAEPEGEDRVECLGALRSRYRLGDGWIEFLEPDGAGPVAEAVAERGGHLFAGGMATSDLEAFAGHLRAHGIEPRSESGQLFLGPDHTGGRGLRLVVSTDEGPPETVGRIDTLYEITNLVDDHVSAVKDYSERFALETKAFTPISSSEYGYEGTLTLLDDDGLDRFEVITPTDPSTTMGRYFAKHGPSLYMCFAETGALAEIEESAREAGIGHTRVPPDDRGGTRPPDTVFLHPPALGGMMLGLSRRTVAWVWSGHPERVEPWKGPST